jgi:hypothetical protein
MGQSPIAELARQVAEAFGAAFPQSTTTQQQPKQETQAVSKVASTPNAPKPANAPCQHPLSSTLVRMIPDPHGCPICNITSHVKIIQGIQHQFADHGGAFASKEVAHHKSVRQRWRAAKIKVMGTLSRSEEMLSNPALSAADLRQIEDALECWEKNKIALTRVPGVIYVPEAGEEEPTEEEHECARLVIELLNMVLEKETTEEDKKPPCPGRGMKRSGPHHNQMQAEASIADKGTQRSIVSWDDPEDTTLSNGSSSTPPLERPFSPTLQTNPELRTPKSILKRKASLSPQTPKQSKRLRISDTVAIPPSHLNTSNASPFDKLLNTVTFQSHSTHVFASQKRPKSVFKRGTPHYPTGNWASGAHEKKAETSGFRRRWEDYEKHVRKGLEKEKKEKACDAKLKALAGAWMGLWWVKEVLRDVDLVKIWRGARKND